MVQTNKYLNLVMLSNAVSNYNQLPKQENDFLILKIVKTVSKNGL
jgi:hypothetical protein